MGNPLNTINSTPIPNAGQEFKIFTQAVSTIETSIILPRNTIEFQLNLLNPVSQLTVSYVSTGTSNPLTTFVFPMGSGWCTSNLSGKNPLTIYLKSTKIDDTVQVMYWIK